MPLLILNLPANSGDLSLAGFVKLPIELPLIILILCLAKGIVFKIVRLLLTFVLAGLLLLKLADLGTFAAFSRPFNPLLDIKILVDGWLLLNGTVGPFEAYVIVVAALLCCGLVTFLMFWSFGVFQPTGERRTMRPVAIIAGAVAVVSAVVVYARPAAGFVEAKAVPFVVDRIALMQHSIVDMQAFEKLLVSDPIADVPVDQRLSALKGKDIVIVFIESYGESVLHDPRYADLIQNRLANVEKEITAAGLTAKSSMLVSPTSGGLSWLAHGTLLSGLWIDSQQRYDRLIASKRADLNTLFRDAGWRNVAVMPAITMAWPEASYFGYDAVYAANNLGYRGKPFNWVTMPDQFTLSAFEKLERGKPHKPIMAEMALISSHAPWTPIPTLLDWATIGDGKVFDAQAMAGDAPEVIWRDQNRVRVQYVASIDYALEVLGSYMAKHGRNTVFILLGDHQPAPIITGPNASRAVPIHIVSDDPALLGRLDAVQWTTGMVPITQTPERMDRFREELVRWFSDVH